MPGMSRLTGFVLIVFWLAGCQTTVAPVATKSCQPMGYNKSALLALKTNGFQIDDQKQRQSFALALVDCLGSRDPVVRDGVAYEALAAYLRGNKLDNSTIEQLRLNLLLILNPKSQDRFGFRRPFAALILAEVVRADRLDRVFTPMQRAEIVNAATSYMNRNSDYRGFDAKEGWRHGVAHTADLMMQLVLNPAVTSVQLQDIADAIANQVAPPGEHFYIYGEPERLARPIYYLAGRGKLSEQQWADWFARIATPAPLASWGEVWSSQAGLAKMHNTKMFAESIYVFATADASDNTKPLAEGALAVLKALN